MIRVVGNLKVEGNQMRRASRVTHSLVLTTGATPPKARRRAVAVPRIISILTFLHLTMRLFCSHPNRDCVCARNGVIEWSPGTATMIMILVSVLPLGGLQQVTSLFLSHLVRINLALALRYRNVHSINSLASCLGSGSPAQ